METEGQRIVNMVFPAGSNARRRLTRHDRIGLEVAITGAVECAVAAERHRCFDVVTQMQAAILRFAPDASG